ncbi:GtrA family protein [Muricoccus aerilatus]|uniref:GtrA family protein n=1 Tax=Muricoccus aerilatus TaxID=452982 RepID=UPI0005C1DBF1|nr:GtrA family protein [Roseomonas aerilata]
MRNLPPWLINFLKFGGLSGLGWIADTCILLLLVRLAGMAPFAANIISSSIAALSVFLLSREKVFNKAAGGMGLRVAGYLVYTLMVILIASAGVGAITAWLGGLARAEGVALSATALAAVAKVLVTPPQLILNFLVSRFIIERDLKGGGSVHG